MNKKLYSLAVALVSLLLFLSIPAAAFAQEAFRVDGDLSPEEGAEIFIQTEENLKLLEKKLAGLNQTSEKITELLDRQRAGIPNFIRKELPVPCFIQQNGYYCGPATVKEVVHYFNGVSSSQEYYANRLGTSTGGTTMTQIPGVLNSCITSNNYAYDDTWSNFNQWATRIMNSIDSGNPVIIDISTDGIQAQMLRLPYDTEGHYLAIIGYSFDTRAGTLASIKVSDPHPVYNGLIWYPASDIYKANFNHWRKAIIW